MDTSKNIITVQTIINAPLEIVWKKWTTPGDIIHWDYASDDWHTPRAENNLRAGGKFLYRMEAKDGSFGFDFAGVYETVQINALIEYTIADGRKVKIEFIQKNNATSIVETFEVEDTHPIEHQRVGWQSILDNFKKYTEAHPQ